MSDFVKLGNRAKLRTQRPYELAKLNAYISLWGLGYITTAFLMATEKEANPVWWLIAFALIVTTLSANVAIYLKPFPLRMCGYVLNIVYHYFMLLAIIFFVLPWTIRGAVFIAILWWWNPCFQAIKTDWELQAQEAESLPPADPADDFDATPDWDTASADAKGKKSRFRR